MSDFIARFLEKDFIKGAILGSLVIPSILFLIQSIINFLINKHPKRILFGSLILNNVPCYIYFVRLFGSERQNEYLYDLPNYFPPHTSNRVGKKINVPYVWAEADGKCLADVINTLGNIGKTRGIHIKNPAVDWDLWDGNIICIGGSSKVYTILDKCSQKFCTLSNDKSRIRMPSGEELNAIEGNDYGMIQKIRNPSNGLNYWIIMGIGVNGTLAASFYLRNYSREMGIMFEGRGFCCIVKCKIDQGPDSGVLYRAWPRPHWYKKFFHPFLWFNKYKKACLS